MKAQGLLREIKSGHPVLIGSSFCIKTGGGHVELWILVAQDQMQPQSGGAVEDATNNFTVFIMPGGLLAPNCAGVELSLIL